MAALGGTLSSSASRAASARRTARGIHSRPISGKSTASLAELHERIASRASTATGTRRGGSEQAQVGVAEGALGRSAHDATTAPGGSTGAVATAPGTVAQRARTFLSSLMLDQAQLAALAAGEFLYLAPSDGAGANVYDLKIVSHTDIDPQNYFTMSRTGVTYFCGNDSEFTTITQWEREYRLFWAVRALRDGDNFFTAYPLWKSFMLWKRLVASRKANHAHNVLTERLFFLDGILTQALTQLRNHCAQVSSWSLFAFQEGRTYDLPDFEAAQAAQRRTMAHQLEEFAQYTRELVRSACDSVLDAFLAAHKIQADHRMSFMERAALRAQCARLTRFVRLCDFIIRDSLLELALQSTDAMRDAFSPADDVAPLPAEYANERELKKAFPHGMAGAPRAESSALDSLGMGKAKQARRSPLLRVKVSFETFQETPALDEEPAHDGEHKESKRGESAAGVPSSQSKTSLASPAPRTESRRSAGPRAAAGDHEGKDSNAETPSSARSMYQPGPEPNDGVQAVLKLTPSLHAVRTAVSGAVTKALAVVASPPVLLSHEDLLPYTEAAADADGAAAVHEDEDDLATAVLKHDTYRSLERRLWQAVDDAMLAATDRVQLYAPFARDYARNTAAAENTPETFRLDSELHEFEEAIAMYQFQAHAFEELPFCIDQGILRIDALAMKQQLVPAPAACLRSIQLIIPQILRERVSSLGDQVKEALRVLTSSPSTVDAFVEKVSMLERAQDQLPHFREHEAHSRQLANVMMDNSWAILEDLQNMFRVLRDDITKLESAVQTAEAHLDEDTRKFAAQVEAAIPNLRRAVLGVRERMDDPMVANPDADVERVITFITAAEVEMQGLKDTTKKYQHYQQMLRQPVMEFDVLEDVAADLALKSKLWHALQSFGEAVQAWKSSPLDEIDADALERDVAGYLKTAVRAERGLPGNGAASKLRNLVEDFKALLPVVVDLRSPALQSRHWDEIQAAIQHTFDPDHTYTLGDLLDLNVIEHAAAIAVVATKAVQEAALLELFAKKVTSVWDETEFVVLQHKDSKDVFILGSVEEIVAALDESLVTINTILGSRFAAAIRTDVEAWQHKLILLSDTLDEWLNCQKQWMYLENIFSADDIKRQLEEESKRFAAVDRTWKQIMSRTNGNPKAIVAGTVKGMKEALIRNNEVLDAIQKSLEEYLETKRLAFPRFYFLSNEELLEILAQTRDPRAVQPHLRKCFDALVKLQFGDSPSSVDVLAMMSPEGEQIQLPKNIKARGKVEEWLATVERGMVESLAVAMRVGVEDYPRRARDQWVRQHPSQIVATVAQIMWCYGTESALKAADAGAALKAWHAENVASLAQLTALVRSPLSKIERRTIVALVTTDVHARDIVEDLVQQGIHELGAFAWQQQLRYYWQTSDHRVMVKQSNSVIPYGYEYQGATTRLVITPLTDRCWMTITGALHLKLGAAPAGPAGTGKTESSKDLAKAIGKQCVVFNCSDQIDYKMLGKLFSGLAQASAWTCLDEFNRIDIEVLSVVAQQLQQLRQGRLAGQESIQFEGRYIALREHTVIITMNPGYAGRTELPDNLKILFRPVAMMVPDYALIAEIILYAEGFDDAKNLSRKMVKLYKLSSEQLSQQKHYDFGMRAVKSVLVMAGALKRGNPDLSEDVVLIRAMRDSNVPKFLSDDLPLFHAIVSDLFPGVDVPRQDLGVLQTAIDSACQHHGLQVKPEFTTKVVQLFETFNVRFGVVIVGPTGAGKTECYRVLQHAMTSLRASGSQDERFQSVSTFVLNPKCITMGELYGEMNELTQEWRDGLASSIMRSHTLMEGEDRKWTVFDGPIDALWIENMNTVLDDNMTLCLANGERIKLKPEMRMLFEVADLAEASPATVSRLGVVYMTPLDLGWRPFVQSWLPTAMPDTMPEELHEHLLQLFNAVIDDALAWTRKHGAEPLATTDLQLVASLCRMLTAMLRHESYLAGLPGAAPSAERVLAWDTRPVEDMKPVLDAMFAFCFVWTVGGALSEDAWSSFDAFVRGLEPMKLVRFGTGHLVHDVFPDVTQEDAPWRKWADVVPQFSYDAKLPYFKMVVPTIDTVRFSHMLALQAEQLHPVFLTGVTGTGKTVVVEDWLAAAAAEGYKDGLPVAPIFLNFSAQTSALRTQVTIEAKLEKKKKTLLGAPAGRRTVIFVDDVNMPAVEVYGAQPPIELLRQLVDFHGVYDRAKLFWKQVVDSMVVCAAAPPGGGRAVITQRFTRHFHVLCMPSASNTVLKHIFNALLGGFLSSHGFAPGVQSACEPTVAATIAMYQAIRAAMRPTPTKSHYTFNLRDVSKVFQSVLMVQPKQCSTGDAFARLWVHEVSRVFHDRLICNEDRTWFHQHVVELLGKHLGKKGPEWSVQQLAGAEPVLWVDYLTPPVQDGVASKYEEARDWAKLRSVLDDALEDYNLAHPTKMNLVFFKDAVEHVSRIARILRQPRGNAMLIGVGGSGKQSLTRMACSLSDVQCFSIELTRGYDLAAFREDMKGLCMQAGAEGAPVAFLFTDTQIVQESFLEDVNNLLNTGEIPGLFETEELTKIMDAMRGVASALGVPETRDAMWKLFVSRVRDNLHIILAMSPVGDALRVRCRNFPALINCCTIDWFMPWPDDALLSVAKRYLDSATLGWSAEAAEAVGSPLPSPLPSPTLSDAKSMPSETRPSASSPMPGGAAGLSDDEDAQEEDHEAGLKAQIAAVCVNVHQSVAQFGEQFFDELGRRVYTTPKSYLDLLSLYLSMLSERRAALKETRDTLANGVAKLEETNGQVADLQEQLTAAQPILEAKTVETQELLERVKVDQGKAAEIKAKVEAEEAEVRTQAEEVQAVQEDAQRDLDVAMPALNNAMSALDKLDKSDITEVKSFKQPPVAVQTVMEAVCVLLNETTDWDSAKRLLGRTDFMELLVKFPKDNIPPATLRKLRKYIDDENMEVEVVKKVSKAATSLCMWVHAMDVYAKVAKEVEPKKARLEEMNQKLAAANGVLAEKQAHLQSVLDEVAQLQAQAEATLAEKERLEYEQQLTQARLARAEQLTTGLADEQVRWAESVAKLDASLLFLIGDVLLAAASVSYYGAFTGPYRDRMVAQWTAAVAQRNIPASAEYSLVATLGDPVRIREWHMFGLPTDSVSVDNAILVTRGQRWPLMIDPQEQAKRWIKNMEAANRLQVSRLTNPNMLRDLENCIRIGRSLLLEDIGEFLDPALEPVLAKAVFKQQGRLLIHLGDSDVDYDPAFKMYLTTKLPNPHYLPEVCIKVTVINFTVTRDGLEEQLLGNVVAKERPDVEARRSELITSMANDKRQLKDLEDKILRLLRESEGNILDDTELIATLKNSKAVSKVTNERLEESARTEVHINQMREAYRPAARRGAIIYFVIADMARVDPMYQFSLEYFSRLFARCIDESEKAEDVEKRLGFLMDHLTQASYVNVCRGLFEAHKLLFSFLVAVQIMRDTGAVGDAEWLLLLRGAGMTAAPAEVQNPLPAEINAAGWNLLYAAQQSLPGVFRGLCEDIIASCATGSGGEDEPGHATPADSAWRAWARAEEPHMERLPGTWHDRLSDIQRLLVLKAVREEKVLFAVKDFVVKNLGPEFVEAPPVSMSDMHAASDAGTPMIFILSVGADPTGMLFTYAKERDYAERLQLISLGQGQGPRAQALIAAAASVGDWVLLQNCHLAKSWMPNLERICDALRDAHMRNEAEAAGSGAGGGAAPAAGVPGLFPRLHPDFRLFLTSMPAPYFPVPVLQNGLKLTNEPPKGLRANLQRSLAQLDTWSTWEAPGLGSFEDKGQGHAAGAERLPIWKRLAFGLAFFHAVVQERRKFGPLGWNITYEFNDSDLETSLQVLKQFLAERPAVPWDALTYVTGQINYGGRVTDDWDRRCLMTILSTFYTPGALQDAYAFSSSGVYGAQPAGSLPQLREYVASLPLNDPPEVFGMHQNANIAFQAKESASLVVTALSLQPRTTGGAGASDASSPDVLVAELAAELLDELPAQLRMAEAAPTAFVKRGEHMDSLSTVLAQEMARFNNLLEHMSESLAELRRAIRGEVLMSEVLDGMYTALLNNQVPENWAAVAYPSLKRLASWVKDLHARVQMLRAWLTGGPPRSYWLSGFFFPQGFMTGALQNHARKYAIPIDTLNFSFTVLKLESGLNAPASAVPADGVLVHGLFMDGGRWDRATASVEDPRPGEMFSAMPVIHFSPSAEHTSPPGTYAAPIYKTSVRAGTLSTTGMSTNFIVAVDLPSNAPSSKWIKAGVALLCQLND